MTPLAGSYDLRLVALSVVIAILAAGAALDLAGRVTASRGREQAAWLTGGAIAMGFGIWSMHYTGMLAFRLPVLVLYHVPTVALSLLAAILASAVALFVASRERLTVLRTAAGSVVMGAGIATMHYTGMAAMHLPGSVQWHGLIVVLSVVIAIGVSAAALWFAFTYGRETEELWTWRKVSSAVLMGLAIPSMHYTGMAAATFWSGPGGGADSSDVQASALSALGVGGTTVLVLGLAVLTSVVARHGERRLRVAAERLRDRERQLAEAQAIAHVGSWEWEIASNRVSWSDELYRILGVANGSPVTFVDGLARVHPQDRERVERLLRDGLARRRLHEYECRVLRPDGSVRHILNRAVIVSDAAGAPVRMIGTSVDITERKATEESQATLLRELQTALAEVKTLRGLIKICADCKRVLTDEGSWEQFESYVRGHSDVEFSHGICPECAQRQWGAGESV